jgi:hypothetical protein
MKIEIESANSDPASIGVRSMQRRMVRVHGRSYAEKEYL